MTNPPQQAPPGAPLSAFQDGRAELNVTVLDLETAVYGNHLTKEQAETKLVEAAQDVEPALPLASLIPYDIADPEQSEGLPEPMRLLKDELFIPIESQFDVVFNKIGWSHRFNLASETHEFQKRDTNTWLEGENGIRRVMNELREWSRGAAREHVDPYAVVALVLSTHQVITERLALNAVLPHRQHDPLAEYQAPDSPPEGTRLQYLPWITLLLRRSGSVVARKQPVPVIPAEWRHWQVPKPLWEYQDRFFIALLLDGMTQTVMKNHISKELSPQRSKSKVVLVFYSSDPQKEAERDPRLAAVVDPADLEIALQGAAYWIASDPELIIEPHPSTAAGSIGARELADAIGVLDPEYLAGKRSLSDLVYKTGLLDLNTQEEADAWANSGNSAVQQLGTALINELGLEKTTKGPARYWLNATD